MGAKNLTTPGGLVELRLDGSRRRRIPRRAPRAGRIRYLPSVNGVTDTGLLAHPHGVDDPAGPRPRRHGRLRRPAQPRDLGVRRQRHSRIWAPRCGSGSCRISRPGRRRSHSCPSGTGRESLATNNAPEGVMSVAFTAPCAGTRACSPRPWAAARSGTRRTPPCRQPEVPPDLPGRPGRLRRRVHHHPGRPLPAAADPGHLVARRRGLQSRLSGRALAPGHRAGHPEAAGGRRRRRSARHRRSRPMRTAIIQRIPARNNGAADCPTVTGEHQSQLAGQLRHRTAGRTSSPSTTRRGGSRSSTTSCS